MMDKADEKPWWFPRVVDQEYFDELREDYPDKAHWTNEELDDYFNEYGRKYSITWDHVGDAYEEYEELADAYLKLLDLHSGHS